MKIVLTQELAPCGMTLLRDSGAEVIVLSSSLDKCLNEIKDADGFIIRTGGCTRIVMEHCEKLKAIARTGVGVDDVDMEVANELGIPVSVNKGVNSRSVAEHTVAFIFACAKNLKYTDIEMRHGNWSVRDNDNAVELCGKKVGIIGVGDIGSIVAKICGAIGMKCIGYSHSHNREKVEAAGCEYCDNLDMLLEECDFISIHSPLTAKTKNMIAMPELLRMKPTAYLINTSRGAVVNEDDLAEAVSNNIIAGAAVDVFSVEPPILDNPVLHVKNIISTPHNAAHTREAFEAMSYKAAEACLAICNGDMWPLVANPDVYTSEAYNVRQNK